MSEKSSREGRPFSHAPMVDLKKGVSCLPKKRHPDLRYALSFEYLPEKKRVDTLTIILKNPSAADDKQADKTVSNVEYFIHRAFKTVKKVHLVNLIPFRAKVASDIKEYYGKKFDDKHLKKNLKDIGKCLEESSFVVCAWGGPNGIWPSFYRDRIEEVKELFKPSQKILRVKDPKRKLGKYPLHAQVWGYREDRVFHVKKYL